MFPKALVLLFSSRDFECIFGRDRRKRQLRSRTEQAPFTSKENTHERDEASEQEAAHDVNNDSCWRGRRREHKCERLEETKKAEDNNNN